MKRFLVAVLAILPFAAGAAAAPIEDPAVVHWKPRSALSAAQAARLPQWCDGGWLEPSYAHPRVADAAALPIEARARRVRYRPAEGMVLEGDVLVEQGNRRLSGESAWVADDGDVARLEAGATLSEPGLAITAAEAELRLPARQERLHNVRFVWFGAPLRGQAAQAQRLGATTRMQAARLTRCGPAVDTWELAADEVSFTEGETSANARGVVLKLKRTPIFYAPRLRIPMSDERQSGFLLPNLSLSGDDGLDLGLPYYLNLHPQYDATVTPRYIERRGAGLELETRALGRSAKATVGGALLADDAMRTHATGGSGNRWLANIDHRGRFGPVSTRIDYAATSDMDYFRDLGTDLGVTSRPFLTRHAAARYARGGFAAGIGALGFQWLAPRAEPYRRLPEIDLSHTGALGPLEWSLAGVWTAFDRPEPRTGNYSGIAAATGRRLHIEPTIRLPLARSWGFLSFGAGYRHTGYDLDGLAPPAEGGLDANPRRRIAFGEVDAGLFFERQMNAKGTGLVQTLEPRLYYLKQQFANQDGLPRFDPSEPSFSFQQLFRRNRFAGLDRIGDADQLAVGLTTRFIGAGNGREYARASLGAIAYFRDRLVALRATDADRHSTSPLVGTLASRIGPFAARADLVWDPNDAEADELGFAFQYRRDNRRIFNVGHRKRRAHGIDQSDLSLLWPLTRKWSALARWSYDFDIRRTNEVMAGVEYATCCWQARAVYRRFVDARGGFALNDSAVREDEGLLLQFVFRGLADFGGRLESALARGIKGYREESHRG